MPRRQACEKVRRTQDPIEAVSSRKQGRAERKGGRERAVGGAAHFKAAMGGAAQCSPAQGFRRRLPQSSE